jgi:ribonuclease P protein component
VDIVILAKRGAQDIDNETLTRQLHGMWKRLQRDAQAVSAPPPPNGVTRDA